WQDTTFKAQLVCDKKVNAIRYKEFLDEIGLVTNEVLISPLDVREGEDSAYEKFQQEVENTTGKAAKADKIASRTAKHISEKMDEDPAFYKKFSQMLKETIADYEAKRIGEVQYLNKVQEIMNNVLTHTDSDIPEVLKDKDVAKAYYGLTVRANSGL
ncbi:unnamed protein product, partial [marine sediment metagenome]